MTAALPQDIAVVWVDYVGSDWLAIYADGERVYEGHPPSADDALTALGIEVATQTLPSSSLADHRRMRGLPLRLPRSS